MSASSAPDDVDALFKLPLAEFTSARNTLAAQLKKAGRQAEASEAKALPKPSPSAWVVNQLYWRHRESFDRLIEAGEQLRRTRGAQLTGDAVSARREALAQLMRIAADILRDGSHNATRDLLRRVTSTLEALSSYGALAGAPVVGRLTDDLEPPGFEAAAGLVPASEKQGARGPSRLPHAKAAAKQAANSARQDQEQQKKLIAAAKASARDAERAVNAARKEAERAAAKGESAAKRAQELEGERAKVEKQLARLSLEAKAAQADASQVAANANEATRVRESAERALELARQRLKQLAANKG